MEADFERIRITNGDAFQDKVSGESRGLHRTVALQKIKKKIVNNIVEYTEEYNICP